MSPNQINPINPHPQFGLKDEKKKVLGNDKGQETYKKFESSHDKKNEDSIDSPSEKSAIFAIKERLSPDREKRVVDDLSIDEKDLITAYRDERSNRTEAQAQPRELTDDEVEMLAVFSNLVVDLSEKREKNEKVDAHHTIIEKKKTTGQLVSSNPRVTPEKKLTLKEGERETFKESLGFFKQTPTQPQQAKATDHPLPSQAPKGERAAKQALKSPLPSSPPSHSRSLGTEGKLVLTSPQMASLKEVVATLTTVKKNIDTLPNPNPIRLDEGKTPLPNPKSSINTLEKNPSKTSKTETPLRGSESDSIENKLPTVFSYLEEKKAILSGENPELDPLIESLTPENLENLAALMDHFYFPSQEGSSFDLEGFTAELSSLFDEGESMPKPSIYAFSDEQKEKLTLTIINLMDQIQTTSDKAIQKKPQSIPARDLKRSTTPSPQEPRLSKLTPDQKQFVVQFIEKKISTPPRSQNTQRPPTSKAAATVKTEAQTAPPQSIFDLSASKPTLSSTAVKHPKPSSEKIDAPLKTASFDQKEPFIATDLPIDSLLAISGLADKQTLGQSSAFAPPLDTGNTPSLETPLFHLPLEPETVNGISQATEPVMPEPTRSQPANRAPADDKVQPRAFNTGKKAAESIAPPTPQAASQQTDTPVKPQPANRAPADDKVQPRAFNTGKKAAESIAQPATQATPQQADSTVKSQPANRAPADDKVQPRAVDTGKKTTESIAQPATQATSQQANSTVKPQPANRAPADDKVQPRAFDTGKKTAKTNPAVNRSTHAREVSPSRSSLEEKKDIPQARSRTIENEPILPTFDTSALESSKNKIKPTKEAETIAGVSAQTGQAPQMQIQSPEPVQAAPGTPAQMERVKIVEEMAQAIETIVNKSQTDTVVTLKSGVTIKISTDKDAPGQVNITFGNLTQAQERLLSEKQVTQSLKERLANLDKPIIIQNLITTNQKESSNESSMNRRKDNQSGGFNSGQSF